MSPRRVRLGSAERVPLLLVLGLSLGQAPNFLDVRPVGGDYQVLAGGSTWNYPRGQLRWRGVEHRAAVVHRPKPPTAP
ncbi:MAG TPA: hypothetical protein VF794_27795 [Archangium sp.]|uniref:hypothetical protein n=1 Tax=Archangium sp. TaxID=1872627 RepID=UPI002ED7C663